MQALQGTTLPTVCRRPDALRRGKTFNGGEHGRVEEHATAQGESHRLIDAEAQRLMLCSLPCTQGREQSISSLP